MTIRQVTWLSDESRTERSLPHNSHRRSNGLPLLLANVCLHCGWMDPPYASDCFRCGARHAPAKDGAGSPDIDSLGHESRQKTLRSKRIGSASSHGHRSEASISAAPFISHRPAPIEGELWCLHAIDVHPFPYQVEAAKRALGALEGRALLGDEVGLGKTIEAGLCIKELILRGLGTRVLVLAPASLVVQWKEELASKIQEDFHIVRTPNDWSAPRLIASHDLIRRPQHAAIALAKTYDLVVVDEAHKLKNPRTLLHNTVASLLTVRMLFLTATPIQNNLLELYYLVSLLRPGHLGQLPLFRREFVSHNNPREAKNIQALRELMDRVMVRHHRDEVGVAFPARRAAILEVTPTDRERALYGAVTDYIYRTLDDDEGMHRLLTLMLLQKELCSSPAAVASTLGKMYKQSEALGGDPYLKELASLAEGVGWGIKSKTAADLVVQTDAKVLLFTDYRATMKTLHDLLASNGVEAVCFHGGLSEHEKEDVVRRFRGEARVMISTESGSEGRNLQFCHTVINLDLPWNPMRLEQRIGRVHRLGQNHDVTVYNLVLSETIEDYIMDILATKIRLFELVVGELDMILGSMDRTRGFEELIATIWRTSRSKDDMQRAFQLLGEKAVAAREEYERFRQSDVVRSLGKKGGSVEIDRL